MGISETVYVRQPAGFVDKANSDHVCLLHKFLYGLKQFVPGLTNSAHTCLNLVLSAA